MMAKRTAFEMAEATRLDPYDNTEAGSLALEPTFFDLISVRETIESIAMAIVLAMIFKVLQAEAYIIPTGSMAPTLMGQHVEVACDGCDYLFQVGATNEGPSSRYPGNSNYQVHKVRCPLTFEIRELARQGLPLPKNAEGRQVDVRPNDESFAGDRIVVSKLEYLWRDPDRWDVIVFKYPGAAKVNYIKRLVGLPGESLVINNGDVFVQPTEGLDAGLARGQTIVRKPPQKLAKIAIPVQDSQHFSAAMRAAGLPPAWLPDGAREENATGPAWVERCVPSSQWQVRAEGTDPATYQLASAATTGRYDWLRFRHLVPRQAHWRLVRAGQALPDNFVNSPGHLVTDYYCYNDAMIADPRLDGATDWDESRFGGNWVGDLVMEAEVEVGLSGTLALDAVEGGVHYLCEIDVATGRGKLSTVASQSDASVAFLSDPSRADGGRSAVLEFDTRLRGAGAYQLRYANCDDRIYLWVNDVPVTLPGDGCYVRTGPMHPYYHPQDFGDARPLGLGFQGGQITVQRLRVARDLYYLNENDFSVRSRSSLRTRYGVAIDDRLGLFQFFEAAERWMTPEFQSLFYWFGSEAPLGWDQAFRLSEGQFFPMGDNSPQSEDARKWRAPKYVERRFLIGKALLVYWPHSWNEPPLWPNFSRMRAIH